MQCGLNQYFEDDADQKYFERHPRQMKGKQYPTGNKHIYTGGGTELYPVYQSKEIT